MGNETIGQKPISFHRLLNNYGKNQQELNPLIETCVKISLEHLRLIYSRIQKLLVTDSLSLEDLAIDSIARLFLSTSKDNQTAIQAAFFSWQPKITNEEETIYFLNKIVSSRVDQHISKLLRESDPFYSKILTTLEYFIKKQEYKKINHFGRICVIYENNHEINGTVMSDDEFSALPANLFLENKILFKKTFNYLTDETEHFPAIPLNALVFKIKQINAQSYLSSTSIDDASSEIEIAEYVKKGLEFTFKKLESGYLQKGKISKEDAQLYKNALSDMSEDLKNGGVVPGLFKYIAPYINNLSKEDYKLKYHNILEYLLKLMKNKIWEMLQVNNGNN